MQAMARVGLARLALRAYAAGESRPRLGATAAAPVEDGRPDTVFVFGNGGGVGHVQMTARTSQRPENSARIESTVEPIM